MPEWLVLAEQRKDQFGLSTTQWITWIQNGKVFHMVNHWQTRLIMF